MLINQASLGALNRGFKTIFNEAFAGVAPQWQKIAMPTTSATAEEVYPWLGAFPKMREWVGERVVNNLKSHNFTIRNKDYEVTVEVPRNAIEDDAVGIFTPVFQELARSAAVHPDELVFALLAQGFATVCFDGQYFFDTDHPVGGVGDSAVASVSNYGGGSGAAWYLLDTSRAIKPVIFQRRKQPQFVPMNNPDDDNVFYKKNYVYGVDDRKNVGFGLWQLAYASKDTLNAANYAAARAAMMSFKDDSGKPLGIVPNLLVLPPSLEGAGREITLNERDANGKTNTWRNTAEILVTPWLG